MQNIANIVLANGIEKFVLISIAHDEENTTPNQLAKGSLEVAPKSLRMRTSLAVGMYIIISYGCASRSMMPVMLRADLTYGRVVKLIEPASALIHRAEAGRAFRLTAIVSQPNFS